MIVSVHLADLGPRAALNALRRAPNPAGVPGLTYAETVLTAPLGPSLLPVPRPGRAGLIAAWEDDAALDEFRDRHPLAASFAGGWEVRLQPLRVSGFWPGMPDLPSTPLPIEDDEPVVALTLGRVRVHRVVPFLRSAAAAEAEAVEDGALLASTGLARVPKLVSTFSIWRSFAAMRDYAYGKSGAHQAAVRADRERPYHHDSAFVRFRPYASRGSWDGRDPLAAQVPSELNL